MCRKYSGVTISRIIDRQIIEVKILSILNSISDKEYFYTRNKIDDVRMTLVLACK